MFAVIKSVRFIEKKTIESSSEPKIIPPELPFPLLPLEFPLPSALFPVPSIEQRKKNGKKNETLLDSRGLRGRLHEGRIELKGV